MSEYYDILGIDKNATKQEIKKAYNRLSMKTHPDKGGNEYLFNKVSEAYNTLYDDKKRREYDNSMIHCNYKNNSMIQTFSNIDRNNPFELGTMMDDIMSIGFTNIQNECYSNNFYTETIVSNEDGVKRTINDNGKIYTFFE